MGGSLLPKTGRLTKRTIDATPHPSTGQIFVRDSELRGLALRVTPGSKSFVPKKQIHGRVRRMTLGRYGQLTVEQARKLALEKLAAIAQGQDLPRNNSSDGTSLPSVSLSASISRDMAPIKSPCTMTNRF